MFIGIKIAEFTSLALCLVLVLLVVFQVIVPIIMCKPLFPMLRHRPKEAAQKLAEAVEEKGVRDVEEATAAILRQSGIQQKSTRKG